MPYYMVNPVPRDPGFYTLEPFKSFNYNPNSCNGETNEQIKNKKQQEKNLNKNLDSGGRVKDGSSPQHPCMGSRAAARSLGDPQGLQGKMQGQNMSL